MRTTAAIIPTAGLTFLAAGCGGTSGSRVAKLGSTTTQTVSRSASTGGSVSSQAQTSQMLASSRCMRSHGVSEFPDPPPSGKLAVPSVQSLGVSGTQFLTAQSACRRLLPTGGNGTSQAEVQQEWNEFQSFARCMRRHEVPNWPDPRNRSATDPRPIFPIQPVDPTSPIDPSSPRIRTKVHDCDQLLRTANPNRL